VRDGLPLLEDGRTLEVTNVIWCTGFHYDFSWIDLPVFVAGEPVHRRGVAEGASGLYFAGLHFLYSASSSMIHGADRDGDHIAEHIASRARGMPVEGAIPVETASDMSLR
jgi:putative flavoprotein involved in K+ transport